MAKLGTQAISAKTTNGSAAPKPGVSDFSEFLKTSTDTMFDGDIMVHGPTGVGKTFFAATASQFWPDELPAKKRTTLDDVLWCQIDAGATAGFEEQKIIVPHVLDFRGAISKYGLLKGVLGMLDVMDRQVESLAPKFLIVDTVSRLDKDVTAYYESRTPVDDRTGKEDKWWAFKQILVMHKRIHGRFAGSGLKIIFLCHSKAQGEATTTAQVNQREAKAVPGGFDIVPEITGQARTLYVGDSSIEGVLKARLVPGKERRFERFFYPFGVNASEGKSRFTRSLKREEGPNPRLKDLFYKIEQAAQGNESVCTEDTTSNVHEE